MHWICFVHMHLYTPYIQKNKNLYCSLFATCIFNNSFPIQFHNSPRAYKFPASTEQGDPQAYKLFDWPLVMNHLWEEAVFDEVTKLSCLMTKPNRITVRPVKTQISLGIRPVWSESLLCAQWVAKDPSFLHADSEDSDQTGRMSRLIWVFAGHICHFVGFVMRWFNSWLCLNWSCPCTCTSFFSSPEPKAHRVSL